MTTVNTPLLASLREIHERIVGAEQLAQAIVAAVNASVKSLLTEQNTLLGVVAREQGIPPERLQVDFQTGEITILPEPPKKEG